MNDSHSAYNTSRSAPAHSQNSVEREKEENDQTPVSQYGRQFS